MSVSPKTKQTPKFTSMKEMKRWQAEREDQLHRAQVRKKMTRTKTKPQKATK